MSEEDTKVVDIFDKDIENFGNDLEKMIEHLNIVIATHNKQVEEIERLNNIINEIEKDIKNLYTYGIKNNAEQRDYLLNRLEGLKEYRGSDKE